MEYTILIHEADECGYWAEISALPGCFSQGETIEETIRNTKEAILLHIESLKEEGQPVPVEENIVATVKVVISAA